jgi:hypothetical protein
MKAFAGAKISVSCNQGKRGDEKGLFSRLVDLTASVGATHSATVHKRVRYLIVTDVAFKTKSQRVRKALKFKIPIVHYKWLEECKSLKKLVDIGPYRLDDVMQK